MSFILGLLVAAKGIALAVGIVLSGGSPVTISSPRITLTSEDILLSCTLTRVFTKELAKLAGTGTEIPLYLMVETWDASRGRTVGRTTVERTLTLDILGGDFVLVRRAPPDSSRFSSRDSALAAFCRFDEVPVQSLEAIGQRSEYYFVIYAILGKTRVEALGNSTLDLMYYWDYRRPLVKTERFRGSDLLSVRRLVNP